MKIIALDARSWLQLLISTCTISISDCVGDATPFCAVLVQQDGEYVCSKYRPICCKSCENYRINSLFSRTAKGNSKILKARAQIDSVLGKAADPNSFIDLSKDNLKNIPESRQLEKAGISSKSRTTKNRRKLRRFRNLKNRPKLKRPTKPKRPTIPKRPSRPGRIPSRRSKSKPRTPSRRQPKRSRGPNPWRRKPSRPWRRTGWSMR